MHPVQTFAARDVTPELCAHIFDLWDVIWPQVRSGPLDAVANLESWRADSTTHFVIRDDSGQVLAQSLLFPREIFTPNGPLRIGALGGVCAHPDYRGRGWGADVARAALDYLPQLGLEVSLFQTPVPVFYEKLGCRLVGNAFFDGTRKDGSKANPFSDKYRMIYPASFAWPEGAIDLNGPEY